MDNKALLLKNIVWEKHPHNEKYYFSIQDGISIILRINNFPEEPLFTLINGLDIMDIEDLPTFWELT